MSIFTRFLILAFISLTNKGFAFNKETFLICKKIDENSKQNLRQFNNKELKENFHKNFLFYFLIHGKYSETVIRIKFDEVNFKISESETKSGEYIFNEDTIVLSDDLKFRVKSTKKELNRNTLELTSIYKGKSEDLHKCEVSSLDKTKKKFSELTKSLIDIYKQKYENFKM